MFKGKLMETHDHPRAICPWIFLIFSLHFSRCRTAAVGAPGDRGAPALRGALALRGAEAPAARPAQGPEAAEAAAVVWAEQIGWGFWMGKKGSVFLVVCFFWWLEHGIMM